MAEVKRSKISISIFVKATSGGASGVARLTIVSQKTRQPTMHRTASRFVSRSAVRSRDASARQPDFKTL